MRAVALGRSRLQHGLRGPGGALPSCHQKENEELKKGLESQRLQGSCCTRSFCLALSDRKAASCSLGLSPKHCEHSLLEPVRGERVLPLPGSVLLWAGLF